MWARVLLTAALVAAARGLDAGLDAGLEGHAVLRVVPQTQEQLAALHKYLQANRHLDVWLDPSATGKPVDIRVSPKQRQAYEGFLAEQGLQHNEFISDVHSLVQQQKQKLRKTDEAFGWTSYHHLEEIYKWMQELANNNPGKVSVVDIGPSHEGRRMKGLIIKFAENLPVAMIESGIHAREWIAHASATYFIDQILKSDESDFVRKYEWHIFPCVNPDGYAYTWNVDRMWRKTRSTTWFIYKGVDENRNWPFHWMEGGATRDPADEAFGGLRAQSEVETRNLRQYVDKLASRMHVYVGLHSYSQLLMFPWGYTTKHCSNHQKMYDIAEKAVAAVKAVAGKDFDFGNIAEAIYIASGSTIDYVYSKCVPFPFVFELRDNGIYGFLLPEDQIVDGAREAWAGVRVIAEEAFKDGVPASNPATCPSL